MPSIPGMTMPSLDANSFLHMQQAMYCNSDQAKVGLGPAAVPSRPPAEAHLAHLGRHLASPRAALPRAS
eukprot:scaffold101552_cov63-Phaeocystis_antarctica.AAC.3